MDEYRRRGSLVWPVILIGLGVVFLLNNLGMLDWSVWLLLARMWPLLLIAIGVDILLGRRSAVGAVLSLIIILALFAGGIWFFSAQGQVIRGDMATRTLSYPLEGAQRAQVSLRFPTGDLLVGPLPDGENLAEGTLELFENEEFVEDYVVETELARLLIQSSGDFWTPFWFFERPFGSGSRTWEVFLTSGVPLALTVETGVGRSELDLEELDLTDLEVEVGVGQVVLYLPGSGDFDGRINGGVGELTVYLPPEAPVRIEVESGLGNTSLEGDYERQGNAYTSEEYEEADERIDLFINGGVGSIQVRQSGH